MRDTSKSSRVFAMIAILGGFLSILHFIPYNSAKLYAQPMPEYRFPCNVSSSGNWGVTRDAKYLTTNQQLFDQIYITVHGNRDKISINLNNNPRNPDSQTYGICEDLTVLSARAGTVTFNGRDTHTGSGWTVSLDHGDGQTTVYTHLQDQSSLVLGQFYPEETVIGTMGYTGNPSGAYLHFEVRTNNEQTGDWVFKKQFTDNYNIPHGYAGYKSYEYADQNIMLSTPVMIVLVLLGVVCVVTASVFIYPRLPSGFLTKNLQRFQGDIQKVRTGTTISGSGGGNNTNVNISTIHTTLFECNGISARIESSHICNITDGNQAIVVGWLTNGEIKVVAYRNTISGYTVYGNAGGGRNITFIIGGLICFISARMSYSDPSGPMLPQCANPPICSVTSYAKWNVDMFEFFRSLVPPILFVSLGVYLIFMVLRFHSVRKQMLN